MENHADPLNFDRTAVNLARLNTRHRHLDVLIIIGYIAAVLVGAALLAPHFYRIGNAFTAFALAHGWRDSAVIGWIVRAAEKTGLPGYFDRAALVVALIGLWPLFRSLRLTRPEIIGSCSLRDSSKHAAIGFILAAACIAIMGVAFSHFGVSRIPKSAAWGKVMTPLISGWCVAALEEFLFRGAMLGVLRRSLRPMPALLVTTVLFALLHFLKPPEQDSIPPDEVSWASGFLVAARLLDGFAEWQNIVAEFFLLFAVGGILGGARMATGGLGLGIGLHAGLVTAMKYFSQVSTPTAAMRREEFFPWVSENHCKAIVGSYVGLVPVAVILIIGILSLRICKAPSRT